MFFQIEFYWFEKIILSITVLNAYKARKQNKSKKAV